jgi:ABC-2 type transport system ATP-binding protein
MGQGREFYIEAARLTKTFRDFWMREKVTAVAELDLQVRAGEVFGLLGPNGSGKSTTIKLILGLLFPTEGRVAVFGKPPTDVRSKARIGFLPEESYLYPFLNARETLDYYGRLFQLPRRMRLSRIDMLLEMVGLEAVAYRRVAEYSKGMQRRIGLAQALINDPDLLILDEPTSGMDPSGSREFKDIIHTLAGRGKTVVLSSHLLADVEEVCDRVCVLYGGRKRAEGSLSDLLAREGRTQIVASDLSETTLAKVRSMIDASGARVDEVSIPQDRLETFFLRIVAEAEADHLSTGGASGGGQVAAFLQGDQVSAGETVIEKLVAAPAEMAESPEPVTPTPAEPTPDQSMLDALVTGQGDTPAEADEQPPTVTPDSSAPPHDVDRAVIDELLNNDGKDA